MAAGVRESCYVILFLSQGVLTRPFVQFEIGEALKARKAPVFECLENEIGESDN